MVYPFRIGDGRMASNNDSMMATVPRKQFQCTTCSKSFLSHGLLERHMRTHTGERPYTCHLCDKRFSQKGNLSKHLKCHENAHLRWNRSTDMKPFKCPHPSCGRSFTAKLNLIGHMETVHKSSAVDLASNFSNEPSTCLHSGCTEVFHSHEELRSHIFSNTPGIVEELKFLRQTALKFAEVVLCWESYSSEEKASMRLFAHTTMRAVSSIAVPSVRSDYLPAELDGQRPLSPVYGGSTTHSEVSDTTSSGHKRSMPLSGVGRSGGSGNSNVHTWQVRQTGKEPHPLQSVQTIENLNHCSTYIHEGVCIPCFPEDNARKQQRSGSVDAGDHWEALDSFLCDPWDLVDSGAEIPGPGLWTSGATASAPVEGEEGGPLDGGSLPSVTDPASSVKNNMFDATAPANSSKPGEQAGEESTSLPAQALHRPHRPEQGGGGLFLPLLDAQGRITAGWRMHHLRNPCCGEPASAASTTSKQGPPQFTAM